MRTRGVHDIATAQNLRARPQADSRVRRLAELARLEREKDRLAREAEMWRANLLRTLRYMEEIKRRQQCLFQLLGASLAEPFEDPPREAQAPNAASIRGEEKSGASERWQTVSLEY